MASARSVVEAPLQLSGDEYAAWVKLLARRTGVIVPPERRSFLETNLRQRVRELHMVSFSELRSRLEGPAGALEWEVLVDRLTVHETSFFRHPPSFELLEKQVMEEFIASGRRSFHAWSAGCSTGQEAWSIAMVLDRAAQREDFSYGVTGSDISNPSLRQARSALYGRSQLQEVPGEYRLRYCVPGGDGQFAVAETLRRRVAFAVMNLLEVERCPLSDLDLIFCQNVLIYFPRPRRQLILQQFAERLRPGGYLIIGPGDVSNWSHPQLQRVAGTRALAFIKQEEKESTTW